MARAASLTINGASREIRGGGDRMLLEILREDLDLCGAKYGCGEGQCGACTVLLDGRAVRACVTSLAAARGRAITTIEGLASGERLHPVQQAFLDAGAMQCGYCVPGMILAATALLARTPDPGEDDIFRAMQGNVCRCGVYPRVVAAIRQAAAVMKAGGGL